MLEDIDKAAMCCVPDAIMSRAMSPFAKLITLAQLFLSLSLLPSSTFPLYFLPKIVIFH